MGNFKKSKTQREADDAVVDNSKDIDLSLEFSHIIEDAARRSDTGSIVFGTSKNRVGELDKDLWLPGTKLLGFADFCESSEHMNFPKLSARQRMVVEYMFGDDPKKIFETGRNTAVLVWGKGSGKDTISALLQCYVVYVLLNLRNPQRFLGMPDNVTLDLLNVAASKEQAQLVFFQIFKTLVLNWKWARNKWDLVINGRFFSSGQKESDFLNKITITNDAVIFPKNIRAFSGSCEAETLEGKNLLMFVLDEADAFKQKSTLRSASKIYRTVRTSASSRFKQRYKGFLISYPRSDNGFIMKMYESTKKMLNVYGDIASTWEVKPRELFSDQTFEFEGHKVPMDFYEDFRLDPMGSKSAFLCDPPRADSLFLDDQDKVDLATQGFVKPLFEFRDIVEGGYVKKVISEYPYNHDKSIPYVLTLDLSLKKDATALSLMHLEGDKVIQDFATAWIPDPNEGLEVSLENVEEIIESIRARVNVESLFADHWNSALLIQKLKSKGVNAQTVKLDFNDFVMFKKLLYAGNIRLVKHQRLLNELKGLQMVTDKKVDHADGFHHDMAITAIMGVKMIAADKKAAGSTGLAAEGEFVSGNMGAGEDGLMEFRQDPGNGLNIDGHMIG